MSIPVLYTWHQSSACGTPKSAMRKIKDARKTRDVIVLGKIGLESTRGIAKFDAKVDETSVCDQGCCQSSLVIDKFSLFLEDCKNCRLSPEKDNAFER